MKIKTTIRKLMDNSFRPTLKSVMEKWAEPKDIHVLVKIAQAVEGEMKAWGETMKQLSETHGYDTDGHKTVNPEEITQAILQEHGRILPDGQLTISGCSDEDTAEFFEKKKAADASLRKFNEAFASALEEEIELEIPRLLKVTDKQFKKGAINANDCFVLSPILDLSVVSEADAAVTDKSDEND